MTKNQKLELTWIGKDRRPKLEARILLEDAEKSYHAQVQSEIRRIFLRGRRAVGKETPLLPADYGQWLTEIKGRVPAARQKAALAESRPRATLETRIKNRLHERQGRAVTNFTARLPAPAVAQETLKAPYLFDFLGLGEEAHKRGK